MLKTLQTEFPQTYVFPVDEVSNIIVIATQEKERLGKQEVIRRSRRLEDERKVQFPLERFAHTYVLDPIPRMFQSSLTITPRWMGCCIFQRGRRVIGCHGLSFPPMACVRLFTHLSKWAKIGEIHADC